MELETELNWHYQQIRDSVHNTKSDVIYFCPWISTTNDNLKLQEELKSINRIVDTLKEEASIDVTTAPNWANLIKFLESTTADNILVVFRLDFLERENMMLSEVLYMLGAMTKFVANKHTVNIAVVVPGVCSTELIAELKRNQVLGIIPGMRFFDKKYAIEAYQLLQQGKSHWPAIAIATPLKRYVRKKKGVDLTQRQFEIFNLIARRGLSNKKIAEILKISEYTVKIHVSAILRRYGVKNRTQLALANETGIIK